MSDLQEALFYLDLDKGAMPEGPLFDAAAERLSGEPTLRAGWAQFQALRALAWETAPQPQEREFKQVLQQCKRDHVGKRLAQATGSDELARELLLGKPQASKGLPAWVWALLLMGTLGLGWLSFQSGALPFQGGPRPPAPQAAPTAVADSDEPLAFEFNPVSQPAEAALAPAPGDAAQDEERVAGEPVSARQARQLLRQHLSASAEEEEPVVQATPRPAPKPVKKRAVAPATAVPSPTPQPTSTSTAVPTLTTEPTPMAQAGAAMPSPDGVAMPSPGGSAMMSLSGLALPLTITVNAPEPGSADLRLFDLGGRSVRRVAEGALAAGQQRFSLEALDDAGAALPPGTYYLRVMTPWFSRVEAVQVP